MSRMLEMCVYAIIAFAQVALAVFALDRYTHDANPAPSHVSRIAAQTPNLDLPSSTTSPASPENIEPGVLSPETSKAGSGGR